MRKKKNDLTIKRLQDRLILRKTKYNSYSWSPNDWSAALCNEVGEFADLTKKIRRGDYRLEDVRDNMGKELADIMMYILMAAYYLNINIEQSVIDKYNEVSKRLGLYDTL